MYRKKFILDWVLCVKGNRGRESRSMDSVKRQPVHRLAWICPAACPELVISLYMLVFNFHVCSNTNSLGKDVHEIHCRNFCRVGWCFLT